MKIIQAKTKNKTYPIIIGNGIIKSITKYFQKYFSGKQIVFICDKKIEKLYLNQISKILEKHFEVTKIIINSGEETKSLKYSELIYTELIKNKIERSSIIVAFGGGVIGDLAGFVASTYLRGVMFAQIPTTLLAQVDSSVGGKVGINHSLGKNLIGSFYQPEFVLIDTQFLKSLPKREITCGVGEIIKYGIIKSDIIFKKIKNDLKLIYSKNYNWEILIYESLKIKSEVVRIDEKENNLRAILNCGHTIGHAIEKHGNFKIWKHGEAVLLGLVAESFISNKIGFMSKIDLKEICNLILKLPIPKLSNYEIDNNKIINTIQLDKKIKNKEIKFSLPVKIGNTKLSITVKNELILQAIQHLHQNF